MKTKNILLIQLAILIVIAIGLFLIYPKVGISISGNVVNFSGDGIIVISDNPDFINPRYVDLKNNSEIKLRPAVYYWKPDNGIIEGFVNSFVIDSEDDNIADETIIDRTDETESVNEDSVRVKIEKTDDGVIGRIVLGPEDQEEEK